MNHIFNKPYAINNSIVKYMEQVRWKTEREQSEAQRSINSHAFVLRGQLNGPMDSSIKTH